MHRTTVSLEGHVEQQLRKLAAQERRSFTELVNDLIKQGFLAYQSKKTVKHEFKWHVSKGKPRPFFNPADRSTYMDLISRKIPL